MLFAIRKQKIILVTAVLLFLLSGPAAAQDKPVELKFAPSPGISGTIHVLCACLIFT
jgi:hypothetical protein